MKPTCLVVDANILVSALLKDSTTRRILLDFKTPKLIAPDYLREELRKYLQEFALKLDTKKSKVDSALNELIKAAKIEIVAEEKYADSINVAGVLISDDKDIPYFALALELEYPIWSNDKRLKKQKRIKVYSTPELIKELQEQ